MARRVRTTRKELLKEPDQFLTASEKIAFYFSEHGPLIIALATIIVLSLAGGLGYQYYRDANRLKMEKLYFDMVKIQEQNSEKNPLEKVAKLEKLMAQFQEGPQKERARLLLAGGYFQNDQFDRAIQVYSEITQATEPGQLQHELARLGLANSYESKKDYKKAVEAYKSIIQNAGDYPLFNVYLGLARCYELDKDFKNALLVLREIKEKYSGHPQLELVEWRIKKLSAGA
ncbi:MAG: tetratricopeptide repeat protein [Nitrospinaceae bacterium]